MASQTNDVSDLAGDDNGVPAQYVVAKEYPAQGALKLYRLTASTEFTCSRCNKPKKAKLVAVTNGSWQALLCNGCYGELLAKGRK